MRTNIEIDDTLMAKALQVTGLKTKRAVVEKALEQLVHQSYRQQMLDAAGTVRWEGDLDRMRERPRAKRP